MAASRPLAERPIRGRTFEWETDPCTLSGEIIVEQYLLDVARAEDKSAQLDVIYSTGRGPVTIALGQIAIAFLIRESMIRRRFGGIIRL
jgi:hypothetical protein